MQHTGDEYLVTRDDYIWKVLRMQRFWTLLLVTCLMAFAIYVTYAFWHPTVIIGICAFFLAFVILYLAVNQFRWERYVRAVGERRNEAIQGTQFPVVSVQPLVQFPVPSTLRLHMNRLQLTIISLVLLAFAILMVVTLILRPMLNTQDSQLSFFLTVLFIYVILMMVCAVLFLNLALPYKEQSIEITEQGIKTRFLRQERYLAWKDIRIFTAYEAQETYKNSSTKLQIYEVANEQIVVRWSQVSASTLFLSAQSNLGEKEDWNWLVGRVNAFVTKHTGLPLLNLGDDKPKNAYNNPSSAPIQLAKNDPLVQSVQWKGNAGSVSLVFGIVSIILFLFGLLGNLPGTAQYLSLLNGGFGYVLLTCGVVFLLFTLLLIFSLRTSQQYWQRIGQLRMAAFQEPEHYTARQQPSAHDDLPQPTGIHMRIGPRSIVWSIVFMFSMYFILNFSIHFFSDDYKSVVSLLISTLIASLFYGIVIGCLVFYTSLRTNKQQRIEVTSDGIATHMNARDSFIHWQDVRLFARYRSPKGLRRSSKSYMYELAGEDVVVRITKLSLSPIVGGKVEPAMTTEELDAWYEQLYGYIAQHTHLPLLDFDTAA